MPGYSIIFICVGLSLFIILFLTRLVLIDNRRQSFLGKVWSFLCGLIISSVLSFFIGGIITLVICTAGENILEREERIMYSVDLITLDTNEDIRGTFFVGSGQIGEEMYYHFYYKTLKGIKYKRVLSEDCYIIETDEKPSYKKYGQFIKDTTAFFYTSGSKGDGRQVLFIPKGTIKSNYKVN